MYNAIDCKCKNHKDTDFCWRHRGQIKKSTEIIVEENNIVEVVVMSPQVNRSVVAEVDMPAPSVVKSVEASNVEISEVSKLDESTFAPVITDSAVHGEDHTSDLKELNNHDDGEYDLDLTQEAYEIELK